MKMSLPQQLVWCVVIFISCCTLPTSWGHRHAVTSAFIKKNSRYPSPTSERRGCLHDEERNARLIESSITCNNVPRSNALTTRGGSSYGDDYNDGYGNYRDDTGDNGRGYNNDEAYYSGNDRYDDRDQGYSPSHANGSGRDRYYDDDYGRSGGGNGYYDDEGRYHEDIDGRGSGSSRRKSKTKLPTALTSSNRKVGIILLSSGAAFTALGITLFFNKTLMRLGNLLFVAGIPVMLGPGRTVGYFLQPKKARATGCLGCGIFLVLVGHPVIGILLEIFGLLNLFGNMFPLVMMMAKNLPVVGGLFGGSNGGSGGKRRESRYDDDRYFEDEGYEAEDRRDERY
mmetsp:Transcript_20253/g.43403  ORF Transcript_20253/g.43403 Transcript_20253/m.43403 type:complete len:341 (-) Transcript_20253:234-1256(-)|eukprot:CAMPEP_0172533744 /NCGR_PEP_ID=MMETSP1067-20121228/6335_1 /TAXON_ID=265564 ORGANISM="Thalassiosira punctigera, Strain Tpunct2005C2" /NCGR_SAMPLE_ID=MMETSP1067 /ASSEMBLY_ACC=CAM_ASM_000444 /LENGTH=340 /DNA_ID=CAMNT_0013318419 /DNA_START=185 /DNA_END=1207 /DNA_ORIENTATION=+